MKDALIVLLPCVVLLPFLIPISAFRGIHKAQKKRLRLVK